MNISVALKKRVADELAPLFTTSEIESIFKEYNIEADVSLYAKRKIILDAFTKTNEQEFFTIIKEFCSPLYYDAEGYERNQKRDILISKLSGIFETQGIELKSNHQCIWFTETDSQMQVDDVFTEKKTFGDYIQEAVLFFENEYNKVRIDGIEYEYELGANIESLDAHGILEHLPIEATLTEMRTRAMEALCKTGFVKKYQIEQRNKSINDVLEYDYAICEIDEGFLRSYKQPKSDDKVVEANIQTILHKHEGSVDFNVFNNSKSTKKESVRKYPHKIPSGTKWEEITINFIDDEKVDIRIPTCNTHHTTYADMGFADGRSSKPTKQWLLFQLLARRNGALPPDDGDVDPSYKKAKQNLEKQLQEYFGIEYDFFKKYNSKDGYVTKATIFFSEDEKGVTNPQNSSKEVQEMFDILSQGE